MVVVFEALEPLFLKVLDGLRHQPAGGNVEMLEFFLFGVEEEVLFGHDIYAVKCQYPVKSESCLRSTQPQSAGGLVNLLMHRRLRFLPALLLAGVCAPTTKVVAENNLYLGINGGLSVFSPGLYSNREIKYKFDNVDTINKTESVLYPVPVLGLNASLVIAEAWIFGYSGSIAKVGGLENRAANKSELKKCSATQLCETVDPHFGPSFTLTANLTRTEHDLSITRKLGSSNWFVFTALRYQYYSVKGERPEQGNNDTLTFKLLPSGTVFGPAASGATSASSTNYSAQSYGGAIGLGYTLNIAGNWYLNMQSGFLILKGNAEYTFSRTDGKYAFSENNSVLGLGASGAASFGYSVTGTHIILLSYKFQVFRMRALSGNRDTVDQFGTPLSSSDNLFSDGAVDVVNTVTLAYIYKVF